MNPSTPPLSPINPVHPLGTDKSNTAQINAINKTIWLLFIYMIYIFIDYIKFSRIMLYSMSYKQTGNKVPVTREELINYTHKQIHAYDVGKLKDMNPYTEPIIYVTKDGKMIQVPQEIQKEAVASWHQQPRLQMPERMPMPKEEPEQGHTDYLTIRILIL